MHGRPSTIGTPGQPWGEAEKAQWRARQSKRRSYADEVLARIDALRAAFDVVQYGELDWGGDGRYALLALRSPGWDDALPVALVTGGVHGYETSGVHGALQFAARHAGDYAGRMNLLVAPCVSPWAYERIHRWNPRALDPNRNFVAD
ncbi:MAG TPA: peptidase, partial [Thermomonas sp.]|nr:peptidase [Thermomonas sp.]